MNRSRKSKKPLISSILMAQARIRAWLFGKVGSQMFPYDSTSYLMPMNPQIY